MGRWPIGLMGLISLMGSMGQLKEDCAIAQSSAALRPSNTQKLLPIFSTTAEIARYFY